MTTPDPLAVLCPQCWAEPGAKCKNYTGAGCAPHGDRTRAARSDGLSPADAAGYIPAVRQLLEKKRAEVANLEEQLARLLVEAGRRPPDGSDQPALFEAEQPSLFGS